MSKAVKHLPLQDVFTTALPTSSGSIVTLPFIDIRDLITRELADLERFQAVLNMEYPVLPRPTAGGSITIDHPLQGYKYRTDPLFNHPSVSSQPSRFRLPFMQLIL